MNEVVYRNDNEVVRRLREAAAAKKCWPCGCLHNALRTIEEAGPAARRPAKLQAAIELAHSRLTQIKYDCLGCKVCFPAIAVNVLGADDAACPSEPVKPRDGWPPLPGAFKALRYHAPVAVCTLTDENLMNSLAGAAANEISIVGTMQTENLGIERLIQNTIANPNIRFLVLCGADSRQAIGHLPGQSLVALARDGVDKRMRIAGARGKRPMLRNLSRGMVEHFRRTVEVVNLAGETAERPVLETAKACAARSPGPAEAFAASRTAPMIAGYIPRRMTSDPAGYFVVFPDPARRMLILEHYRNEGVLDTVIEGSSAAELYIPAIEKGLVSRLDHAAYLGKELARAQSALLAGERYTQDAAPERDVSPGAPDHQVSGAANCGCETGCGAENS